VNGSPCYICEIIIKNSREPANNLKQFRIMPTRERRLKSLRKLALEFNGVYFDTSKGLFKTMIKINGTNRYFGYHKTASDAAQAVNEGVTGILGSKKAAKASGLLNEI
jgi:hypothetical protein